MEGKNKRDVGLWEDSGSLTVQSFKVFHKLFLTMLVLMEFIICSKSKDCSFDVAMCVLVFLQCVGG